MIQVLELFWKEIEAFVPNWVMELEPEFDVCIRILQLVQFFQLLNIRFVESPIVLIFLQQQLWIGLSQSSRLISSFVANLFQVLRLSM